MAKIKLVEYSFEADKKVFFVDYSYEADEKVFIVDYDFEADYKAYKVEYAFEADLKVFRVEYAFEADEFSEDSDDKDDEDFSESYSSSYTSNSSSNFSESSLNKKRRNITRKQIEIDRMINELEPAPKKPGCLVQILIWLILFAIVYGALNYFGFIGEDDKTTDESITGKIINTEGLNLRRSAGTDGEIIKLMIQNDSIWQINDSSEVIGGNTWIFVTDKTDTGWVNQQFIK
jgi:hypothetical protein